MTRVFSPRREDISSIHLRAIFDYWQAIRRDRLAPDTGDFDPLGLPAVALRYIIVADVFARPFRVQYRLVGTHGVEVAGFDFTGRFLHELEMPEDAAQQIEQNLAYAATRCAPLIGRYDWPTVDGADRIDVEYIILPLLKDGVVIRLLTAEHVGQDSQLWPDEIIPIAPMGAKVD
ncbi:MAG TPA: PAS domain-containing protein [Terriglobales bacterium]|nr:PAS domain-containing protein [Terriglobales bacterium]